MHLTPQSLRLTLAAFALTMAASAQAQIVVRDSETGKLRAATASEVQAMKQAANEAVRTTLNAPRIGMVTGKINPAPITHPDGTVEQELDASSLSYTVAQRNADGSVSLECVTGEEQAKKALAAKPAASAQRSKKGHQHDVK